MLEMYHDTDRLFSIGLVTATYLTILLPMYVKNGKAKRNQKRRAKMVAKYDKKNRRF